jgi:hypothetical protein
MDGAVMPSAEHGEVRQLGESTRRPMTHVVPLTESDSTAGEPASTISMMQRAPQCGRNRARARPDLHDAALLIVTHHHAAHIAREPLRRFRGNARATLEDRLTRLFGVRQHGRIHVDHHLIALTRRAGIELVMQSRFRKQHNRVRLLLGQRGRRRGYVGVRLGWRLCSAPLVEDFSGCGERSRDESAGFRRESPA